MPHTVDASNPPKALVVTQSVRDRVLTTDLLQGAGYITDVVGDGLSAIDAARHNAYDVILIDIQLSGLGGVHVARLIHALGGHNRVVPIIGTTNEVIPGQRESLLRAGLDGHLARPFAAVDVTRILDASAVATRDLEAA